MRATPGAKAYIFQSRINGKSLRITIGSVKDWSIDKAREEARRLQTLIDQGQDPRQVTAATIAAAEEARDMAAEEACRQTVTVSEAWAAYIAYQKDKMGRSNIERGKKWGARHLLDHERLTQAGGEPKKRGKGVMVAGVLCPLLGMRMVDITADTLKAWLRKESETRANNARQGFEAFRAFWRWCASRDEYRAILDPATVEDRDMRAEVPGRKPKEADCLQREQLPAWFAAVRHIHNPVISAYLQTLLLIGSRREELAGLKWEDVDFRWNSLTIADKVEGSRTIPLTPYVASLLADLKRRNETPPPKHRILHGKKVENDLDNWKPSPWAFSSPTAASGRLQEPSIQHRKACAVAGLDVSLHGLRRSFASLAEWVEMPAGLVAQIVGHKPSATAEKHYKRRPLDLLRLWHGRYEAWLLEQAGIEFEAAQPGLKLITAA